MSKELGRRWPTFLIYIFVLLHILRVLSKIQELNPQLIIFYCFQHENIGKGFFNHKCTVRKKLVGYLFIKREIVLVLCERKVFYLPRQLRPFPLQPVLHAHVYDPAVFVHVAWAWQLWRFRVHSSISEDKDSSYCMCQN